MKYLSYNDIVINTFLYSMLYYGNYMSSSFVTQTINDLITKTYEEYNYKDMQKLKSLFYNRDLNYLDNNLLRQVGSIISRYR